MSTHMTFDQAVAILECVQEHLMQNTKPGVIPADRVAERFGVTRGQGLTMIVEANRTLKEGRVCPTCDGVGRLKNA